MFGRFLVGFGRLLDSFREGSERSKQTIRNLQQYIYIYIYINLLNPI